MEKREDKTVTAPGLCICGHFEKDHVPLGKGGRDVDKLRRCTFAGCHCGHYVEEMSSGAARKVVKAAQEVMASGPGITQTPELRPVPPRQIRDRKESVVDVAASKLKKIGAPEELRQALFDQLKRILEKPIGPKMLKELAKTALLSQRLLITAGDPNALPARRRGMGLAGYGQMDAVFEDDDMGFDDPVPIASPAETFGASAIRELIAATKEKNKPGVVELTKALAIAKEHKLDKVAEGLQTQLEGFMVQGQVDIMDVPTGGWPLDAQGNDTGAPIEQLAQDVTDILDGDPEGGVA